MMEIYPTPRYQFIPAAYHQLPLPTRPPIHLVPTPIELPPKSALTAGLLQAFLGMGHFYLGNLRTAVAQQVAGLIGLLFCVTGWFITVNPSQLLFPAVLLALGVMVLAGTGIWVWIDAGLMLASKIRDSRGRELR